MFTSKYTSVQGLHIVTIATQEAFYLPYLRASCRHHGQELTVLGMGRQAEWQGLTTKLQWMLHFLRQLPQNDLVCFVDGYDVICTHDLHELPMAFRAMCIRHGGQVVIAHNLYPRPWMHLVHHVYYKRCKGYNLNSGTYMGRVRDIQRIIQRSVYLNRIRKTKSDQQLLTLDCIEHPEEFCIDTESSLFLNINDFGQDLRPHVQITNGRLTYNDNQPFFVHANGNGILDTILVDLGYRIRASVRRKRIQQLRIEVHTKFWFHLRQYVQANKWTLVVFLVCVCLFVSVMWIAYTRWYKRHHSS